eukprot:UN05485
MKKMHFEPSREPSTVQYIRLGTMNGVPMIGFGFVDNFFMLLFGDFIDASLCVTFGLSTLFAAGLANTISDVGGLTIGGFVERLSVYLGMKHHGMSISQLVTWKAWFVKYTGMMLGITLGCILGMCPLLWPEDYRLP